jgi:hypothetical protein
MTRVLFGIVVLAISAMATPAQAADLKIIANVSVKASEISLDDLKAVFLITKQSVDGSDVMPVLIKAGAAHEALLKDVLGKSDTALGTYYRSLVFTGKAAMPKSLATEAEVIAYVAKTKGAVGYVSAAAATPGVKTLALK